MDDELLELERAAAANPDDPGAALALAQAYARAGDLAQATVRYWAARDLGSREALAELDDLETWDCQRGGPPGVWDRGFPVHTGEGWWTYQAGLHASGLAVAASRVVLVTERELLHFLTALDPLTGEEVWEHEHPLGPEDSGPAVYEDRVLVTHRSALGQQVLAVSVDDGRALWTVDLGPSSAVPGTPPPCLVVVEGRVLLTVGPDLEGSYRLACLRADDGVEVWSVALPRGARQPTPLPPRLLAASEHDAPACLALTHGPLVCALDASTGAELWTCELPGSARSLALTPAGIAALTTRCLVVLTPEGQEAWRRDLTFEASSLMCEAEALWVAGAYDCLVLSPSGEELLAGRLPKTAEPAEAVIHGRAYLVDQGDLHCLDCLGPPLDT
jgi:outer membrane protein assembly factor BamB